MTNPFAQSKATNGRLIFYSMQKYPWSLSRMRFIQILAGCIHSAVMKVCISRPFVPSFPIHLIALYQRMKHFDNDTTAAIATAISGSSAVLHFANTWQPLFALILAFVGIVSGLFAIRYYAKKIDAIDGKGK